MIAAIGISARFPVSALVPEPARALQRPLERERHHRLEAAVRSAFQRDAPLPRQWHVIARYSHALEPAAALELGKRVVAPVTVDEVTKAFRIADLDGLGHQRVVRQLVTVPRAREDLRGDAESSGVAQHDEADHLAAVICGDHVLAKHEARKLTLDG